MKTMFVTAFLTTSVICAVHASPWLFSDEEVAGGDSSVTGTVSEFTCHLDNSSEGCGCGKPK